MKNLRKYGNKPYSVAVIHGGPGAPGYMAPVARELASTMGVLEPLQTKNSLVGQIEELAGVVKDNANLPVVLIGHSWGAMLSYMTTARYPALVKKLILVGMPAREIKDRPDYSPVWLSRLSEKERVEFLSLANLVWDGAAEDKSEPMAKLFRLIAKGDSYDQIPAKDEVLEYQLDINIAVGLEMRRLLADGKLPELGRQITCPVTAIHGDSDPRPAAAVAKPLSGVIKNFKFILLDKCGHYPWMEKYAKDRFYEILKNELK